MVSSNIPFQIISDGKSMYVINGDKTAYKIIAPYLRSCNMNINPGMIEQAVLGGASYYQPIPGSVDFTLNLVAQTAECIESNEVLLDFFQSASIRDLLKEINKKIEARE